jgi:hypothetical protein
MPSCIRWRYSVGLAAGCTSTRCKPGTTRIPYQRVSYPSMLAGKMLPTLYHAVYFLRIFRLKLHYNVLHWSLGQGSDRQASSELIWRFVTCCVALVLCTGTGISKLPNYHGDVFYEIPGTGTEYYKYQQRHHTLTGQIFKLV